MLRTILVGVLITLTATPGVAAVLCQKRSGALSVRETCKKRETPVDPAALGIVGPKGDAGPAGAARAFAGSQVSADGTLAAPCAGRPSKNVVSIIAPDIDSATTCFVLDPSVDASSATVLATVSSPSYGYAVNAILYAFGTDDAIGCPENSVVVRTARYTESAGSGTEMDIELIRLSVSIAVM